jgi:hypothetical protein
MAKEMLIHLPLYHPGQMAVRGSRAKRKVLVEGRRWGKTTLMAGIAVEAMLAGRRVLEAAPVADQTDAFWEYCTQSLSALISAGIIYKNETDRLLRFGKGRIRAKTAWNADTLRGDYADLLILDEYPLMDSDTWDKVGAPMLLDNDGDALFIGTPKRKNHFFAQYAKAMGDDTGRWAAWHGTSLENPYLSRTALTEITQDMTEDAYKQEILAEFLEGSGAVFRNIAACMGAPTTTPEEHAGHRIAMGVDWAKFLDYSCLSVVCATCKAEVAHDRFNTVDYVIQRQRLATLALKWKVSEILAESNSIGIPNLEMLRRDADLAGILIKGFDTTAVSKPILIENLVLAFERAECQWLPDPIWKAELEAYEMKTSANTGRPSYSAPEGIHDDCVMSMALAWRQVLGGGPATVIDNPFL